MQLDCQKTNYWKQKAAKILSVENGLCVAFRPFTVESSVAASPFPGDISSTPNWSPRIYELKHGLVLNWLVDTGGFRVMHIDSADYISEELSEHQVDVLCLGAVGRRYKPSYVKEVISLVKQRWVVPCQDAMLTAIDVSPSMIPGVDLPGFICEIRNENAEPLLMPILGQITFGD